MRLAKMSCLVVLVSLVCLAPSVAQAANILFIRQSSIVGNADDLVIARLTGPLGQTVTQIENSDAAGFAAALPTTDLVMISSTVNSGTVRDVIFGGANGVRDCAKPIFLWEDALLDELQIRAGSGGTPGLTDLTIADPANPLAAGLSGTVTVYSTPLQESHGSGAYAPGAHQIATVNSGADATINYMPKGGQLLDGTTAVNRRLMFFLWDDGFNAITADGLKLFDAAVNYMLPATLHPGDANGDNKVSVGDLGILAANYGNTTGTATWAMADFTGDGNVTVGDLGILAANYGWVGSIPEPMTLSLLGLGMLGLARRRH